MGVAVAADNTAAGVAITASGAAPTRANAEQRAGVVVVADNTATAQANTAAILAAIGQLGNRMGEQEQRFEQQFDELGNRIGEQGQRFVGLLAEQERRLDNRSDVALHAEQLQTQEQRQAALEEKVCVLQLSHDSKQTNMQTQLNEQKSKLQGFQEWMEERQQQVEKEPLREAHAVEEMRLKFKELQERVLAVELSRANDAAAAKQEKQRKQSEKQFEREKLKDNDPVQEERGPENEQGARPPLSQLEMTRIMMQQQSILMEQLAPRATMEQLAPRATQLAREDVRQKASNNSKTGDEQQAPLQPMRLEPSEQTNSRKTGDEQQAPLQQMRLEPSEQTVWCEREQLRQGQAQPKQVDYAHVATRAPVRYGQILEQEITQCCILQAQIQSLSEHLIQCSTYEKLTWVSLQVPIMQKQLTVRLGEMHTHYHVSGIYYSIPDALKMQHVSVKLSDSWRKLMELIAEQQENGSHKQKQEEQRVRYEEQRIQSEEMDRKWQERVLYAQHLCIDRKRAWIERQRSHEALDGQDVRKWEHSKINKLEMQLEVMVANLGRRHDCLLCPECVCCASRVGISDSGGHAICHQSFEDRHRAYFATTKRLVRSRDKGKFKFAGLSFEEPYSPFSDDVTNESFKEPYSPSSDDAANDASSDEGSA